MQRQHPSGMSIALREVNSSLMRIPTSNDVLLHQAGELDEGMVSNRDCRAIKRVDGVLHLLERYFAFSGCHHVRVIVLSFGIAGSGAVNGAEADDTKARFWQETDNDGPDGQVLQASCRKVKAASTPCTKIWHRPAMPSRNSVSAQSSGAKTLQRPASIEVNWEQEARRILKAELARRGTSYKVLVARLEAMGVADNEAAIANRISRGKFSFLFFLQCMRALEVEEVRVGPLKSRY